MTLGSTNRAVQSTPPGQALDLDFGTDARSVTLTFSACNPVKQRSYLVYGYDAANNRWVQQNGTATDVPTTNTAQFDKDSVANFTRIAIAPTVDKSDAWPSGLGFTLVSFTQQGTTPGEGRYAFSSMLLRDGTQQTGVSLTINLSINPGGDDD